LDAAVWGFIGTIVGTFASIATSYINARNEVLLQASDSSRARMEQFRAFQLETLLDLQDAVHEALRMVSRSHHEDLLAFRGGAPWGTAMISTEVDEGMRIAFRRVSLLTARLTDDQLRNDIKSAIAVASEVSAARDESHALTAFVTAMSIGHNLMESIGNSLRSQY
jgi:hypothetical protein